MMNTPRYLGALLLFASAATAATARRAKHPKHAKTKCKHGGIEYCEDPSKVWYTEVRCNRHSCKWRTSDMKPDRRPRFCVNRNVVITSPNQTVKDWQEPCLLWEIAYGSLSQTPSPSPATTTEAPYSPPPTFSPVARSSGGATLSFSPSQGPSVAPSSLPSQRPSPIPSAAPSAMPSGSDWPSGSPSHEPTLVRSSVPSSFPSDFPTSDPSAAPSHQPSPNPSQVPTRVPTDIPITSAPVVPRAVVDEALPTGVWVDTKTVLVTFFVSPPSRRRLTTFDIQDRVVLLGLTQEHLLQTIPDLAAADLLMATFRETSMPDGNIAVVEAIQGQVSLKPGAKVGRDALDGAIEGSFQGDHLEAFMGAIEASDDPTLKRIYSAEHGIPNGLPSSSGDQSSNANVATTGIRPKDGGLDSHVVLLAIMATAFLAGLVFFLCVARRSYTNSHPSFIKTGGYSDGSPTHASDIPENIEPDGGMGVTVSELAVDSIAGGASESASIYSYKDHSAGVTIDRTVDTYEPSYCNGVPSPTKDSSVGVDLLCPDSAEVEEDKSLGLPEVSAFNRSETIAEPSEMSLYHESLEVDKDRSLSFLGNSHSFNRSRSIVEPSPATLYQKQNDDTRSLESEKSNGSNNSGRSASSHNRSKSLSGRVSQPSPLIQLASPTSPFEDEKQPQGIKVGTLASLSYNICASEGSESESCASDAEGDMRSSDEYSTTSSVRRDRAINHIRQSLMAQLDQSSSTFTEDESLFMGPNGALSFSERSERTMNSASMRSERTATSASLDIDPATGEPIEKDGSLHKPTFKYASDNGTTDASTLDASTIDSVFNVAEILAAGEDDGEECQVHKATVV